MPADEVGRDGSWAVVLGSEVGSLVEDLSWRSSSS